MNVESIQKALRGHPSDCLSGRLGRDSVDARGGVNDTATAKLLTFKDGEIYSYMAISLVLGVLIYSVVRGFVFELILNTFRMWLWRTILPTLTIARFTIHRFERASNLSSYLSTLVLFGGDTPPHDHGS